MRGFLAGFILFVCCSIIALVGCKSENKPLKEASSHLRPLAVLYGKYLSQNMGKPPADEKAFRDFIQAMPPAELDSYDAKSVDSLFISTRDQKPYVLIFTPAAGPPMPGVASVVAYEQVGVGGKRYIATSLGEVKEITLAELQQLVPSAK